MNIPKSLHTVSAIVAVARLFPEQIRARDFYLAAAAAASALGYPADTTDTYGLIQRAADTLKKAAP
jgi:hypothetical protein